MSNVNYQPPWILPIGTAEQLISGWSGTDADSGSYWYYPA